MWECWPKAKFDELFHRPENIRTGIVIIAVMMIVLAIVLLLAERIGKRIYDLRTLSFGTAAVVGLSQALAIIPGVSRSGSTITAGLFMNLKRESAARFSSSSRPPLSSARASRSSTTRSSCPPTL